MNQRQDYRHLIQSARRLAATPIDVADAQEAINTVRRRLRNSGSRSLVSGFERRWVWISGSVAAAIVVAIIIAIVVATLPKPVDAARALRTTSQATSNFRGWVHVTYDISHIPMGAFTHLAGDTVHFHINNANGDIAIEFKVLGSECITMLVADTKKEMEYIGLTGELQISSLSTSQAERQRKSMRALPLNPEEVIAQ